MIKNLNNMVKLLRRFFILSIIDNWLCAAITEYLLFTFIKLQMRLLLKYLLFTFIKLQMRLLLKIQAFC